MSYLLDVYSQAVVQGNHLLSLTGACAEESLVLSCSSVQIHSTSCNPKTHAQTQCSHTNTAAEGTQTYIYYFKIDLEKMYNTKYKLFDKINVVIMVIIINHSIYSIIHL